MAKFALIRSKSATVKAFNTRYTASKLLKQFKCKNVVELDKMKELEKKDIFQELLWLSSRMRREVRLASKDVLIP